MTIVRDSFQSSQPTRTFKGYALIVRIRRTCHPSKNRLRDVGVQKQSNLETREVLEENDGGGKAEHAILGVSANMQC